MIFVYLNLTYQHCGQILAKDALESIDFLVKMWLQFVSYTTKIPGFIIAHYSVYCVYEVDNDDLTVQKQCAYSLVLEED